MDVSRSIDWHNGHIRLLDQRVLPHAERQLVIGTVDELVDAINTLAVRGAPALGIAGALGVALSAARHHARGVLDVRAVHADAERLIRTRPTAVNLSAGVRRALDAAGDGPDAVLATALAMLAEDERTNRSAARHAADWLLDRIGRRPLRILTHCNTGRLATAAWGTALGTVRDLHARGLVEEVLATETRPLLQGARLTVWELQQDGIPVRLCPDGAAASALASGRIDCVLVGADRIAANGDTANKVGTYPLALAAARHRVPFLVVAPTSTVDESLPDGSAIGIEQRPAEEVVSFAGRRSAPPDTAVFNPAFDVTPYDLIDAVVTEHGVRGGARDDALARRMRDATRLVPDFPEPGVGFQDLAGVYRAPGLLRAAARSVSRRAGAAFNAVLGIEARGFPLAAAVAAETGVALVLARKPGKTPGKTLSASYASEYSADTLEIPADALGPDHTVLIVDDVLATGGTLAAARSLVESAGAAAAGCAVLTEITSLKGAERLAPLRVDALRRVTACAANDEGTPS
ncbi:S-methyl-5-thioribose-1-phosphate isomerase [Streptomyces sp. NPDC052020]|uniref:S-methyl-5-thioribose-1-phosphate isomerase n=1 Tax=Streptomyces sp. NPDC052020 TaxID=3155677 RepID=UPI00343A2444